MTEAEWLQQLNERCARAMIRWLADNVYTKRTISSLTLQEFKTMADVCTSEWIVAVSERKDRPEAYEVILMG